MIFTFCLCPVCKQWMQFPEFSSPQQLLIQYKLMLMDVRSKAYQKLLHEGRDKDEAVHQQESVYYKKPQEYAVAIYSFYECFKCRKAYFGGAKDCQRALEEDNQVFNPTELVCPKCCNLDGAATCPKHGLDYIEYKCRFCCNPAVFFCW